MRYLASAGLTALRRHVWFSTLRPRERSVVELTARCVDRNLHLGVTVQPSRPHSS